MSNPATNDTSTSPRCSSHTTQGLVHFSSSSQQTHNPFLRIAPHVAHALAAHAPVVALESTIITHGMPYPENLRTAQEVEAVVRAHGAWMG